MFMHWYHHALVSLFYCELFAMSKFGNIITHLNKTQNEKMLKKQLLFQTGYFAFHTFYAENAYMVWVVWMNYVIHFAMYRWVNLVV